MFSTRPPFRDRRDAGRQLAAALAHLAQSAPLVLALPRGGVPVAYEVARALKAPLDVFLVRKIGAPQYPELGLGAVAEGQESHSVLNPETVEQVRPSEDYLAAEQRRQVEEIARRRQRYRGDREPLALRGRTVILVDDGVATGGTMKAALQAVAAARPARLVFAVPVAPPDTVAALRELADDGVCLFSPPGFRAVSLYYADFDQTGDDEVVRLLHDAWSEAATTAAVKEPSMQTIAEIMTRDPVVVSPQDTLQRAAQLMKDLNVGALPVCNGQKLVGMITDRDITIRASAAGQAPDQASVQDAMSDEVLWCYEDQTVGEVLQHMGDAQVRRIPVMSRDKDLVGMVALGDIAARHDADTDATLEEISTPSAPERQGGEEVRLRRPPSDQADGRF
ncbi:MAG TPA: CBS domain-containing protein [Noviherbaspirillum sp.]|uniref:CBS domain-containing protein n=1 Tax=Noviherbaspirillum sp. TaxID=1926288 RepID=UPI002D4541D7|nr:CBS domain-containing protein [Noviherbaspirillum sp.]HYD95931.1 CBS domain-containing protein [Noviherbaspirillum sp.]